MTCELLLLHRISQMFHKIISDSLSFPPQKRCNPSYARPLQINLQIEIRKAEFTWSLLPAEISNLLCESSLSTGDILSSSLQDCYLPPGCLQPFYKLNIHLSISSSHSGSKILLATGQQSSTSLEHVVSGWYENHSLYLCCSALNLEGHPAVCLRGACAVLQRALHLYSRLLLSLALSVVGTAGAQWCGAPWRASRYFNYSCRLYRANTATMALEKGWGKKSTLQG